MKKLFVFVLALCLLCSATALAGTYSNNTTNAETVLTTTLKGPDGRLVPVKTAAGIPKAQLLTCMQHLPPLPPDTPHRIGAVAAQDPFGLGVDLLVSGE